MLASRCADRRRMLVNAWDPHRPGHRWSGLVWANALCGITPAMLDDPGDNGYAWVVAEHNRDTMADADLFVADADLSALLDAAAPTMPDQELDLTEALAPNGFVWFADPLPDRSGVGSDQWPVRALSWSVVGSDHPTVVGRPELFGLAGRRHLVIVTYIDTADMQLQASQKYLSGIPALSPNSSTFWTDRTLIGTVLGYLPGVGGAPGFYQRLVAAFWTLARQPLTATESAAPGSRSDRRRAARTGVARSNDPVRVVRLRRYEKSGGRGAPTGRKVSTRHAVRGFWRNQWLPGSQTHRQQWIAPHWRGPVDGPVSGAERVFAVEGRRRTGVSDRD